MINVLHHIIHNLLFIVFILSLCYQFVPSYFIRDNSQIDIIMIDIIRVNKNNNFNVL